MRFWSYETFYPKFIGLNVMNGSMSQIQHIRDLIDCQPTIPYFVNIFIGC